MRVYAFQARLPRGSVSVLISANLLVAWAPPASAQSSWTATHCYYGDDPGRVLSLPLPLGYHLSLQRSSDAEALDGSECSASVRDSNGSEVWRATGFGAGLEPWTGHDVDGDGQPDAVIAIDTGGGNHCCWTANLLRMTPSTIRVDTLEATTTFAEDTDGRTVLWDIVPFYDLGPDMADAPTVRLARMYRDGRLVDVNDAKCPALLDDTNHGSAALRTEWDAATPALRAAARVGSDSAWAVQRTRVAVTTLALQHLACGTPKAGRALVDEAWPPAAAEARWNQLATAWAEVAGHYGVR